MLEVAGTLTADLADPGTLSADLSVPRGGGGITPTGTKEISINTNGTTTEDITEYANVQIETNVPNSYSAGDEGKVVSNGALVAQTAHATVTQNGTVDTTLNNSVTVNVTYPTWQGGSY